MEDCEEEQVNSGPNILGNHQKANYDTGEVGSDEKEKEAPTNQARKGDSESKSAPPKKKFKSNTRDPAVPATNLHSQLILMPPNKELLTPPIKLPIGGFRHHTSYTMTRYVDEKTVSPEKSMMT